MAKAGDYDQFGRLQLSQTQKRLLEARLVTD
jgi:hypothetical protein